MLYVTLALNKTCAAGGWDPATGTYKQAGVHGPNPSMLPGYNAPGQASTRHLCCCGKGCLCHWWLAAQHGMSCAVPCSADPCVMLVIADCIFSMLPNTEFSFICYQKLLQVVF